jgi:hypothetical protein
VGIEGAVESGEITPRDVVGIVTTVGNVCWIGVPEINEVRADVNVSIM